MMTLLIGEARVESATKKKSGLNGIDGHHFLDVSQLQGMSVKMIR